MDQKRKRSSDESIDDLSNIHGNATKFNIICSIQNISKRTEKTGERIDSPTCVIGSKGRSEWCLTICPNGDKEDLKELSILNDIGEVKNVRNSKGVNEFNVNGENDGWGFLKFVKKDFLLNRSNGLLLNDQLKIFCQVEIIDLESENHHNTETSVNIIIPQSKLSLDYGDMFESPSFADCTIKVGDTEIKVHKAVLTARSPFFL
uniref:BTB domain-containing protein n=1 Tax=Strongyloides papillosus TaxID=174720 RepID=A0A0N5BI43_STREA